MIKAVLLVAALMIVVVAIIVVVNYLNIKQEIKTRQAEARKQGLEYDPKTKTYYDPEVMDRSEKKGVISFKSKSNDK